MSRWAVLVNPAAGGGRRVTDRARSALAGAGVAADLLVPETRESMRDEIAGLVAAERTHFVAVGGDGTVNALVNDLLEHPWPAPPVLGVLPAGTGCDLIRTFGISQHMEEAARHLTRPGEYLVDVASVTGAWGIRHFVNVGETGVAAAAVRWADRLPARFGRARYPVGLAMALPRFRRDRVRVRVDDRHFDGEALAVIFANGQFFGGGFNIAPKATLVDGLLDVQIITAHKRRAARLVPRIYRGMHLADRDVRRHVGALVEIETNRPWPVEVDGEYVGNTPVTVGVARGRIALKI